MAKTNRLIVNSIAAAVIGFLGSLLIFYAVGLLARTAGLDMARWAFNTFGDGFWLDLFFWVQDFLIAVILSLPVAIALCLLRPRRLSIYTLFAVVPTFLFWNWSWVGNPNFTSLWWPILAGWSAELLMVPIAVLLVRSRFGVEPPNQRMQFAPAAPDRPVAGR
ncbi:MAG: hypothetical protein O7F13_03075 [Gammaproteobacteria bacterium]|nr:hypothetical protein [Gammaproteobacteria bacterium]